MIFRPRHRFIRVTLIGVAALTLASGPASATAPAARSGKVSLNKAAKPAPAVPAKRPAPASDAPAPPAGIGLMAFLDPDTGLLTGPISSLVPPADQRAASANVLLEPVPLPNGGWMLDLKGTGMESYVLHIDALGHRTVSCGQDSRTASAPVTAPAVPRRER
jgi:hypothetical protein